MGGVEGDRGEQRIDFVLVEGDGVGAGELIQIFPLEHADSRGVELGQELVIPAAVLVANEGVDVLAELV